MSHRLPRPVGFNVQRVFHEVLSLTAIYSLLCAAAFPSPAAAASSTAQSSAKRGLIDITTLSTAVKDNAVLTASGSDITWYYNYGSEATPSSASSSLEYIPMLWGTYKYDTFASNVTKQLSDGVNITTVMGFNEPDGCDDGGSCMTPAVAAQIWISQIEPLKKSHGLKLGSPATTGSQRGLQWMADWLTECNGGCNPSFITAHWYGDFEGLASWIGQLDALYSKNMTGGIWITEFAYDDQTLANTQSFYNTTIEYLDRIDYVTRYAYFGAFRSSVSNVGENVPFLNADGKLTDIGSWYMGGNATGNVPTIAATGGAVGLTSPNLLVLGVALATTILFT